MVVTKLNGGLGNQLFQYAAGRAVAKQSGAPLFLDTTLYSPANYRNLDITQLNIRARLLPNRIANALDQAPTNNFLKRSAKGVIGKRFRCMDDKQQGYDSAVRQLGWFSRLDGYWQSELYFLHLRDELIDDLKPVKELSDPLQQLIKRVSEEESVAMHVRRGDLLSNRSYAEDYGALSAEYYHEALRRMRTYAPHANIYVFTDDPQWCHEHIVPTAPMNIVSGKTTNSAIEDFIAMKMCRHYITANSTFSWWSAWLGNHSAKKVIAPTRFFRKIRPWEADFIPPQWDRVESRFERLS
jgi:hypothetical protein